MKHPGQARGDADTPDSGLLNRGKQKSKGTSLEGPQQSQAKQSFTPTGKCIMQNMANVSSSLHCQVPVGIGPSRPTKTPALRGLSLKIKPFPCPGSPNTQRIKLEHMD